MLGALLAWRIGLSGGWSFRLAACCAVKAVDEIRSVHAPEFGSDVGALFGLVPEEEHALAELLGRRAGGEDRFERVGMVARGPDGRADGHGSRGEVLHLFELETHIACFSGELSHVLLRAAGVRADEVGDELLVEADVAAGGVEEVLEVVEERERRFAHQAEHAVGGVLGGHFESA